MIRKSTSDYCRDDVFMIENYQEAIESDEMYECHHRLESHDSNGNIRPVFLLKKELVALDMYYNRPADELIFLKQKEHRSLHSKNTSKFSNKTNFINGGKKTRFKEGNNPWNKGGKLSTEEKEKISNTVRKTCSDPEWKKAHSEKIKNSIKFKEAMKNRIIPKGRHWYNNGLLNKLDFECPEGFVKGKIRRGDK